MPIESFNMLKAERISKAQERVKEAEKELQEAQAAVNSANAELAKATTDAATAAARAKLLDATKRLRDAESRAEFEQSQLDCLLGCETSTRMTITQYCVFGFLALVVLVFLMVGISLPGTLSSLSSVTTSRGLITFLVTVVTVAIALILILSSIVSDSPNLAQRFRNGKEIFVALIGILGTIIGFYFGQTTDQVPKFEVGPAYATAVPTADGKTITLTAFAHGGRPPYKYKIDFSPASIPGIDEKVSPSGLISAKFPTKATGKISYTINATDNSGNKATYDSHTADDDLDLEKK